MNELWLVRHGQTEWSKAKRHTGRTDLPLSDEGQEEAKLLRSRLERCRFDWVLVSPLLRARETCRIVGYEESAITDARLAEWDYGAYEGLTTEEIRQTRAGWNLWKDGVPGGETIAQVGARIGEVLDLARSAKGDVALFGHGHSLRVLAACWLALSPAEGRLFALDPCAVGVLGYEREQQVIRRWNDVCHLLSPSGARSSSGDEPHEVAGQHPRQACHPGVDERSFWVLPQRHLGSYFGVDLATTSAAVENRLLGHQLSPVASGVSPASPVCPESPASLPSARASSVTF